LKATCFCFVVFDIVLSRDAHQCVFLRCLWKLLKCRNWT